MSNIDTKRLESTDYEHPLDREALKALKKIPLLDKVVTEYIEFLIKMNMKVVIDGNDMLVTPQTSPRVHRLKQTAQKRLNMQQDYPLYQHLEWDYNAFTSGIKEPFLVFNSSVVQDLTDNELLFIIGHELGHIKSNHVLYKSMAKMILGEASAFTNVLVSTGVQLALFEWSRKAELTADRAGLLACNDIDASCRAMAKLMGTPADANYFTPSMESIVEQAQEFNFADLQWQSKIAYVYLTVENTHPWGAVRISEMQKWIQTGDYRELLKLTVD